MHTTAQFPRTLLLALVAFLAAVLPTLLAATPAAAHEPEQPRQDDVVMIVHGEVSDAMWEGLRELGYTGVAGDQAEALYVPRDVATSECRTDSDCRTAEAAPATWYERDNAERRAALGGCEQAGLRTDEDLSCVRVA